MPRAKPKRLSDLGQFSWEGDDQIVDALLRVASGDPIFHMSRGEAIQLRQEFERTVQLAIDDPGLLYDLEFSARLHEVGQAVKPKLGAAITRSGRSQPVWYRDFDNNFHALLSQGVLLLLDEGGRYRDDLCRCVQCGRFYLARRNPKGGPANRSYCSEQHRLDYHNSTRRKEAPMSQPVAEHFLGIVEQAFPKKADIVRADESGDLRLLIDWRLGTDPQRPNKRSKSIELRVSYEAISDYANSTGRQQKVADALLAKAVKAKLAEFDENHNARREVVPPREKWVISTHDINT